MNIVCLNPPFKTEFGKFSRTSRSPAVTKSGTVYYPIWLCYAAGSLENAGHNVKVIDSCAERINITQTIEIINEFNPDLVLLDTSTPSILSDLESGKTIKETILKFNLDKQIYQEVIISKKNLFPHLTMNILFIGTVFVIGGAVHTQLISKTTHGLLYIFSMIHFIYLIKLQHNGFKETANILAKLGILIEGHK